MHAFSRVCPVAFTSNPSPAHGRLSCYCHPASRAKRGSSPFWRCSQLARFSNWQARAVSLNYDTSDIVVNTSPESASVALTIPLISIALVDRLTKEDKCVSFRFRKSGVKDLVLRFEDSADRDQFCMELHLQSYDLLFSDDGQWNEGAFVMPSPSCHPCTHLPDELYMYTMYICVPQCAVLCGSVCCIVCSCVPYEWAVVR